MSIDDEVMEDVVARRIIMRREVWDSLVHLSDAFCAARGIDVTPTDVATIAVEEGIKLLTDRMNGQAKPPPKKAPKKKKVKKQSGGQDRLGNLHRETRKRR